MRVVRWLLLLLIPMPVGLLAQENAEEYSRQLWLNFILGRPISEKWYFEYDFEAAKQVSGGQPWRYLYKLNFMVALYAVVILENVLLPVWHLRNFRYPTPDIVAA